MNFKAVLLVALVAVVAVSADPKMPVFPQSFTVVEADTLAIHQGQFSVSGGNLCCADDSNCEVQTEFQSGTNYVDAVNNRTRFDQFGSDQSVFFFQKLQKEFLFVNGTCQSYCPTQGEFVGGFGVDPSANFSGTTTIDGKPVNIWQSQQTFIGIVMQTTDFYADQSGSSPIPVMQANYLTPFGESIGGQNATWSSWKPGVPKASLFNVKGLDSCPESQNCNSNQLQMHRLRHGFTKTYMYYKYGPDRVANMN